MPKARALCLAAALVAATVTAQAHAATWTGANTTTANNQKDEATNIDATTNWDDVIDPSGVPGPDDIAIINWSTATSNTPNTQVITIGPDALFNPGALVLNGGTASASYLALNKSLTLTHLTVTGSGTSGGNYTSRLRLGANAPVTLHLTGSTPFQNMQTWGAIQVGTVHKVIFDLSNPNILIPALDTPNATLGGNAANYGIGGALAVLSSAQLAAAPEMRFTAEGGTITLVSPGYRAEGSLSLGSVGLFVRNDQVWEADPAAYIRVNYRIGDNTAQPVAITSINGGRLDNLGKVNLVINAGATSSSSSTAATGMRIAGGTYGSLRFVGGATSFRDNHLVLSGDVNLAGYVVTPGVYDSNVANRVDATPDPDFGLLVQSGVGGSRSHKRLLLNGYALNVTNGVLIDDQGSVNTSANEVAIAMIDVSSSTLNVGGPLVIQSATSGPDIKSVNESARVTRSMGLRGNADSVLNLGGDYSSRVASLNGAGLQTSTLNFVGGASQVRTFEVGDAASLTTFSTSANFNIGTLNIGTAVTPGKVKLVNDYLNDNPIVFGQDPNEAKTGEKLIVGDLNIAADSSLDVNGLPVLLSASATLAIDSTGTLDLNTGLTLNDGDLITTFVGLGDQTATWNLYAAQVIDSSNPGAGFTAVLYEGNTVWQASLSPVPEPGLAVLSVGFLGAMAVRRRRNA